MTLASLGRFIRRRWLLILTASVVLAFITIHIVWYIQPTSGIASTEDLHARLTDGQPTVVEFYTNL
ncbi:MAG: hypothetical protein K8S97_05195 [Anaerolineae bacterium]|nr:hypothetical protein [Anaerolineae bacterium]